MEVSSSQVVDHREESRFELPVDGHTALLVYERRPGSLVLIHTEVPPELRGRHLGDVLMQAAIDASRREHLRIVPVCPFAKAYLAKHPLAD